MDGAVWPLVSAAEMRALDRHTIESLGVPADLLMECAGQAVAAQALRLRAALAPEAPLVVACGVGGNGGDGLVAARRLHMEGAPVRIWPLAPRSFRGAAAANWRRARAAGVPVASRAPGLAGALVVDALFGAGLSRAVAGAAAAAIRRIRAARERGCRVLSVDLPSGLDADTGQPLGIAVAADCTLTLGLPKLGLALPPGRGLAGRVRVARIGIADAAPDCAPGAELWTRRAAAAHLPPRPADSHKGSFGHVLVVAGSRGKSGAAALAAAGAARIGAGLVTIACPESAHAAIAAHSAEAMSAALPETPAGALSLEAEREILALAAALSSRGGAAARAQRGSSSRGGDAVRRGGARGRYGGAAREGRGRLAVVLGPGLSREPQSLELARRLALRLRAPLVLDADAAVAFAGALPNLAARRAPCVLTPHPGEAAALLGATAAQINSGRVGAARRLAGQSGAVALLKGAATVAAAPGRRSVVNPTGGPLLAAGGSGDVLAGMVGGLLAQGAEALEAAALAAYVHGAAADRLAACRGSAGTLAGELAAALPATLHALARDGEARAEAFDVIAFPEPR
ncbi:MAG: NAD(P)H-hydrate dehydratase [Deltaproteobacteria bacterium]|nr:NAD(P)H-hydrate dehydratase [Deltaproteobacteria bacterium]